MSGSSAGAGQAQTEGAEAPLEALRLEAAARAIYEHAPEYLHVTERDGKSYYTAWSWLARDNHQKRRCYRLAEKVLRAADNEAVAHTDHATGGQNDG